MASELKAMMTYPAVIGSRPVIGLRTPLKKPVIYSEEKAQNMLERAHASQIFFVRSQVLTPS